MVSAQHAKLIAVSALLSICAAARIAGSGKWRAASSGISSEGYAGRRSEAEVEDEPGDEITENHFQEIYMLQSAPGVLEFGHVCEDPRQWEQRYEKRDFDSNRHRGKVRWSDEKGSHGEHYWDFNHSGSG